MSGISRPRSNIAANWERGRPVWVGSPMPSCNCLQKAMPPGHLVTPELFTPRPCPACTILEPVPIDDRRDEPTIPNLAHDRRLKGASSHSSLCRALDGSHPFRRLDSDAHAEWQQGTSLCKSRLAVVFCRFPSAASTSTSHLTASSKGPDFLACPPARSTFSSKSAQPHVAARSAQHRRRPKQKKKILLLGTVHASVIRIATCFPVPA